MISFGFRNAWNYKSLWILGFFAAGGGGASLDWPWKKENQVPVDAFQFLLDNPFLILALVVMALVLALIFITLHFISIGGLIDAGGRLRRSELYTLGSSFSVGASNFWRLLGMGLMVAIVVVAFVIVLVLIGVVAYFINLVMLIISLLVLLPIFIVGIIFIMTVYGLAQRLVVLEKSFVFDAIGKAFDMMRARIGQSIAFALIFLGISIAVGIAILSLTVMVASPFIAIGFMNLWLALLTGIPVVLLLLILVGGYTGSALNLMSTEFYFQLKEALLSDVSVAPPPEPTLGGIPSEPPPAPIG